jgi:hypothetical protein
VLDASFGQVQYATPGLFLGILGKVSSGLSSETRSAREVIPLKL